MKPIPYVLIKCALSLDGYLDDTSNTRLLISNKKDFEQVEKARTSVDAILVGTETIRKDNPNLILKKGSAHPKKVTITLSGNLDKSSNFFTAGNAEKIVYTTHPVAEKLKTKLESQATIIGIGEQTVKFRTVLEDLYARGIRRLLIEGGSTINTQFLQEGLVDELQLSVAGFFVGDKNAPRFVKPGNFPWNTQNRMKLQSVQMLDEVAVLTYKTSLNPDTKWLHYINDIAQNCPSTDCSFAVGAALVDSRGNLLADGFSQETDSKIHAEEVVLQKIANKHIDLTQTTLYSSLEPCATRASKQKSCAELIIESGIKRVVFAAAEPPIFTQGKGAEKLREAGIEVVINSELKTNVINRQSPVIQKQWKKIL